MTFWAYMLHCRGGAFYVGHTDDLERRVAQHQSGAIAGFTADHLPVTLVWSDGFATRDEAKSAERRIKGWSRAKKMALIRGDWGRISKLAKSKNGPSTSSGRTGGGTTSTPQTVHPELVEGSSFLLHAHPSTPARAISKAAVEVVMTASEILKITFRISGKVAQVNLPSMMTSARADGLWQATCFELFLRDPDDAAYLEFNFSPSTRWAAYKFDDYRAGMTDWPLAAAPMIFCDADDSLFALEVTLALPEILTEPVDVALSAVIEERDGTKSYWALRHPPGPPDFHHRDCFALTLGAPDAG